MIWAVDDKSSSVPKSGPLRDAGVWEEALVYDQLWRMRGLIPSQADELKLWHIGIMLGVSDELRPPDEKRNKRSRPRQRGTTEHNEINRQLIRDRVRHAKGLGPKPEPPGVALSTLNEVSNALGGHGGD